MSDALNVSLKETMRLKAAKVEAFLEICLDDLSIPERLKASMRYSLGAGGKRLRPVLCLSCAGLGNFAMGREKNIEELVLPFAASIEMIHTYSLIHDDLPAMDDDDLRRGKPSNHKAFDEATAILAGDGLLSDAFYFMAGTNLPPDLVVRAIKELSLAVGSSGMVGGQALDMLYTGIMAGGGRGHKIEPADLRRMHSMKTGALIRASCLCGGILSGLGEQALKNIADYGAYIGVAFQIVDDILDVTGDEKTLGKPVGSDAEQGKLTCPALFGLEKSREMALEATRSAQRSLNGFFGADADFLRFTAELLLKRAS